MGDIFENLQLISNRNVQRVNWNVITTEVNYSTKYQMLEISAEYRNNAKWKAEREKR